MTSRLAASSERVWDALLQKDTFLFVTRGIVDHGDTGHWPDLLFSPSLTLRMRLRLLGLLPETSHEVRVVQVDAENREIQAVESGKLVPNWNHRMRVESLSSQECSYSDHVKMKAGLLTPMVWIFACWFYRVRQRRWRTWLAQQQTTSA